MEWVIAALVFGSVYLVAMGPAVAGLLAARKDRPPAPADDLADFLREHQEFARECREAMTGPPPDHPGGPSR